VRASVAPRAGGQAMIQAWILPTPKRSEAAAFFPSCWRAAGGTCLADTRPVRPLLPTLCLAALSLLACGGRPSAASFAGKSTAPIKVSADDDPTTGWPGCTGAFDTTGSPSGVYFVTDFGCSSSPAFTDSGDNCCPAGVAWAAENGLCASGTSTQGCTSQTGTPDAIACERQINWFSTGGSVYGLGTRLQVTNPANGNSVVVLVLDEGPACWREQQFGGFALDVSYPTIMSLFGEEEGTSDRAQVQVAVVDPSTPLGPTSAAPPSSGSGGSGGNQPSSGASSGGSGGNGSSSGSGGSSSGGSSGNGGSSAGGSGSGSGSDPSGGSSGDPSSGGSSGGGNADAGSSSPSTDPCAAVTDAEYCGDDIIAGDPDTLYQCTGGVTTATQVCANGCQINPSGDDSCAGSSGDGSGDGSGGGDDAGSGGGSGGGSCSGNGDCNPGSDGSGLICVQGTCVPGCVSDAQCPGNTSCVSGQCQ